MLQLHYRVVEEGCSIIMDVLGLLRRLALLVLSVPITATALHLLEASSATRSHVTQDIDEIHLTKGTMYCVSFLICLNL